MNTNPFDIFIAKVINFHLVFNHCIKIFSHRVYNNINDTIATKSFFIQVRKIITANLCSFSYNR